MPSVFEQFCAGGHQWGAGAGKSNSIDVFGLHELQKGEANWLCWPLIPAVNAAKEVFWATKPAWSNSPFTPDSLYAPVRRPDHWEVARKTRETIILCEAAGFDKIFVETVG